MSTAAATMPQTEGFHKIFTLVSRSKSGFYKKSNPMDRIETCKTMHLFPTSICWDEETQTQQRIALILHAPTIFIEDRIVKDADGRTQVLRGLRSIYGDNLIHEKRNVDSKNIKFDYGVLNLDQYGGDDTLVNFVNRSFANAEAPNRDKIKHQPLPAVMMYKPVKKENDAAQLVEKADREFEALEYAMKLRTKGKDNTYSYNEPQMDAVLAMLGEPRIPGEDAKTQKFAVIHNHAKMNGSKFMELVELCMAECSMVVGKALAYKIIYIGKDEAKFVFSKTDTRPLCSFSKDGTEKEKIEQLKLYFIADEKGQTDFEAVKYAVQEKIASIGNQDL